MQLSARGFSQGINLSVKNSKLEKVFAIVEQQTKFRFVYSKEAISLAKPVSIELKNGTIEEMLKICLAGQWLSYTMDDRYIILKVNNEKKSVADIEQPLRGKIINAEGEVVAGITVRVKNSALITTTNSKGEFSFAQVDPTGMLLISGAEIMPMEININQQSYLTIKVSQRTGVLDETVVIGYGTTTQRFTTGSVSKISAAEISQQPVQNPLAALQGRVPGLIVTSTSGVPGAAFTVQIRGQNSINSNPERIFINPIDQPLFIIDGVPFAPQNANINLYQSIASAEGELYNNSYGGMSPFQSINPADIESIEVLRDADATAIYGSRAANGVILITTKKGKEGKPKFGLNIYSGASTVTRTMPMMNTSDYLAMRKEAFSNDGIIPNALAGSSGYAPDLTIFDSTRTTNWMDYFFGGTANTTSVNASFSGGNAATQFILGSGYSNESNIFPGKFGSQRGSFNFNLRHQSSTKRLMLEISSNYSYTHNDVPGSVNALTAFRLPPNYPDLLTQTGEINWEYNGIILDENPLGYLKQNYSSNSRNLISRLQLSYELLPGLIIRSNFGYNTLNNDEILQLPKASFHPGANKISMASFGSNDYNTYIIEPQATYKTKFGESKVEFLLGATYQHNSNFATSIVGSNYSNDALLGSIAGAATRSVSDGFNRYKYAGVFGRINYILNRRYILTLNGRRDGSSRFGPGKQFGNFASIGAGWIFSDAKLIKQHIPWLSYGKLRSSYGTTGNDGIGNYQYLSRWGVSLYPYQSVMGYVPQNLYNPGFGWSETRKLEVALEFGFLQDRIIASFATYRNRCGNQLAIYNLPIQTGFNGVIGNFPALVQNTGFEFSTKISLIRKQLFGWTSQLNFSTSRNKVIAFPGIENSSYVNEYIIGQPLSVLNKFIAVGVNPLTGIYEFESVNGITSNPVAFRDYKVIGNATPQFTGGMHNSINRKNFQLDFFIQFTKQEGPLYTGQVNQTVPGTYGNQPAALNSRWRKPGEVSMVQRLTSQQTGLTADAARRSRNASNTYGDASFARLKTLSFSYSLGKNLIRKMKMDECRIYLQAQNLFTITSYEGNDPETMSFYSVPPFRIVTVGVQFNF